MHNRHTSLLVAISSGLLAGLGYPNVDLACSCRQPASEACVWGNAYFRLTLAFSLISLGGLTTGVVYAALAWLGRKGRKDDA